MKFKILVIDCMRGVRSTPRQIPYLNNNKDTCWVVKEFLLMFNRAIGYNNEI